MSADAFWWIGIILAVTILGLWLWWHGKKTKAMEEKPKPK